SADTARPTTSSPNSTASSPPTVNPKRCAATTDPNSSPGRCDWCRLRRIAISYIEPGSPWENPYVESFNSRARDELLNLEDFGTLLEAQVVVEAWRIEYNTYRPHGALGGLTPRETRTAWTTEHQP